ncbi:MAG: hypothetical protein NTZ17_11650 [Phycisphaerae bacterium]|nr:hypothetical protein [Phycisphaerae bacterium]
MRGFVYAGCAGVILFTLLVPGAANVSPGKVSSSTGSKPRIMAQTGVLIETYDDGKLTPIKLIADYLFAQDEQGVWRGYWRHICITPFDADKDVCLKIEMWSTVTGEITHFQPFSNGCSFDLIVSDNALFGRRTLQVIVKEEGIKRTVLASGLWHSEITKTEFKKEWRSTDKLYFELPYNRVF